MRDELLKPFRRIGQLFAQVLAADERPAGMFLPAGWA
jgi:hypothetical protein